MQRDREPSLIKPSDLAQEPYVHTLFEGDIEGLRQWMEAMSAHPYIGFDRRLSKRPVTGDKENRSCVSGGYFGGLT